MLTNPIQVLSETELLGHKFTVYGTAENPLFLAKEVAECIDYAKTSKGKFDVSNMVSSVDEEEKLVRTIFGSGQNLALIHICLVGKKVSNHCFPNFQHIGRVIHGLR